MKKFSYLFLLLGLASACFSPEIETLVVTGTVSDIDEVSGIAEGIIISLDQDIQEHGHCWINDTLALPDLDDLLSQLGPRNNTGNFQSVLSGLSPRTSYAIRAYAIVDGTAVFGRVSTFTTIGDPFKPDGPLTFLITDISTQSARALARISTLPDSGIVTHGHCWDISREINQAPPTIEDDTTSLGVRTLPGEFSSQLNNLLNGATYVIRAYYITEELGVQTVVYEPQTETFQTVN